MKLKKRFFSKMLVVLMLFCAMPVTGFASSEIWPGYPGVDRLPAINTIPDPFKFFDVGNDPNGDGYVSNPSEWEARRNEIKDLVQRYWLGYRWPTDPEDVVGETRVVMEPNEIKLGFDWPPYFYPTIYNLSDEFYKLVDKLLEGQVEIRELIPVDEWGSTTEGAVRVTFGPADNPQEAEAMAIEAWNAGYYLPYTLFFSASYAALKDFTGEISAPPPAEIPVTYHTVTVENPDSGATASFNINVTTPSAAQVTANWGSPDAQAPVIIDVGGVISQEQIDVAKEHGYAYIRFNPGDIYPDDSSAGDGINRNGVYTELYPYDKDVYEYASGALMAWSWGASQVISAIESTTGSALTWGQKLNVDPGRTLVTGHSRYGKVALFAAAFDDRFDICIPSESGGSGIQSYRYKVEGKIFNFNTYPKADRVYGKTEIPTVSYGGGSSWFPETAAHFVNKDNQLPFDSSDIISLVAPRPFLATTGIDAHWLGNEGAVAAVQAASEVYACIGSNDIEKNNIAVRARESDHVLYNCDFPFIMAIMDREFKQADDKLHVRDLFPDGDGQMFGNVKDYGTLGSMSYPDRDYNYVSEFNSYPFDINSSYLPWSHPDKYKLWTAQENLLVGYPVTITAYSDAPDVKLYLPDGTEVDAAAHEGEKFTFSLSAEQSIYGRYELRTVDGDKENRSVFFAAVSLADSLRHATSKGDEGEENRLIGFSSRLANSGDDPPEVYVGGSAAPVSMSFTPERFKVEETTLLEYGIQFHDKLFERIANEGWDETKTFYIKNLKFVTIPGFTFEISFGNIYASAGDSGKEGADRFTQPISWNVERYNNGPAKDWPEIPDTKAEKEIVLAGGTVTRPTSPGPKPTDFDTIITGTGVQRAGDKTKIIIGFNEELDSREFGFGIDVTSKWETSWSADKKQVTLTMDYDEFPAGSKADVVIFRLKDTEGNMIPGPIYLSLSHAKPTAPDDEDTTSPSTAVPAPAPSLEPGSTLSVMPVLDSSGVGTVKLDDKKASELLTKNITVVLPEMAGANAFAVNMPTKVLSGDESAGKLTVSSKFGKLEIPGNMLQGVDGIDGKDVGITISEGDKESLPADVKAALGDKPLIRLSFSIDGKQAEWNNPNAPVTVSIPYTPTPEELKNPENIVVWYIDGSGNVITIPNGRYDPETGMVVFSTTHFSQYAVAYVKKTFADLAQAEWARKEVEVLAAKEIIKTLGDTFNPSVNITRAEFLYSLVRALGADAKVSGNFDDVAKDSYYYNEIAVAKALGITNGVGGNKFDTDSVITRQYLMTMTDRALRKLGKIKQQAPASELDRFADKSRVAPYAVNSVAIMVKEGLIIGSNDMINPAGNATRAEAAVFIYRLYNKY